MEKTVLIVEDEFMIAMSLETMFEDRGWRVTGLAPSVKDALRLLELERPAVALLDVNLGTEMVTPVAEALKSLGVPFALASAYDRPELFGGAILASVPNVGKPTNESHLFNVLEQLVRQT
ncbi:response regulator [Gemmobacter sp. 24YEA27]|uniref:response regulator n=1 Tax=Gemmobacter sp. 24YEA27 TaxID=3040672 RepID=UPI0024B33828|nr:response regulator [Gemmobacter sp. 24YEA27]